MKLITLTPDDAATVAGPTMPGHALEPFELSPGIWALPDTVLTDTAHRKHHAFLASLPTIDPPPPPPDE